MTGRRVRWAGLALAALATLAGCRADTGIIVAVTGQSVEELEFQVAVSRENLFIVDASISGERHSVQGRDLKSDPYELLLREDRSTEDAAPPTVRVLALGYQAGKVAAFALMEPPQAFQRGELLRRTLVLSALASGTAATPTGKGCYSIQAGGKSFLLVAGGDHDCDGYGPDDSPPDCNDAEASVNPAAREVCDGKDNNCDGRFAPPSETCYKKDLSGVCREGSRACTEGPNGGGLGPDCVIEASPEANPLRCLVYDGCFKQTAPLLCLASRLPSITYACTLEIVEGKGTCGSSKDLGAPSTGTGCSWNVVNANGWPITLQAGATTCATKLVVGDSSASGTGNVELEFVDEQNKRGAFVTVQIGAKHVTTCSSQPLSCAKK